MYQSYVLFNMILLSAKTSSTEISILQRKMTNVITLSFCESMLPAKDRMGKKTLEEVHSYAQLKLDPTAALPQSFTICSTIMTTGCQSYEWPVFVNMLDNNGSQFLNLYHNHGRASYVSRLQIVFNQSVAPMTTGKLPPLFPNQWTRSCVAVNTTSGLIHWVVDGTLVVDEEFVEMKNPNGRPRDLSKKIVLGGSSFGGTWRASTGKVTNLEIFSSPLSIQKMKGMTRNDSCVEEGDYLAWGDMEWILHGEARKERIEKEETCEEKPLVDLYYTQFPGGMDSCILHCEKLGSRIPSVASFREWTKLQTFLKRKLYDKGLNTLQMWLPITDRETKGIWKDYISGPNIQKAESLGRLYF